MRKQANKACGAEQAECVDAKVEGVDEGVWCRASRRRSRALQMVLMKGAPDGAEKGNPDGVDEGRSRWRRRRVIQMANGVDEGRSRWR